MPSSRRDGSGGGKPRVYSETEDLAAELDLKPGEIIHAYVESIIPGAQKRLLLDIKGRRVVAASRPEINAGDSIVVRVKTTEHPVELKVFTPDEVGEQLGSEQVGEVVKSFGLKPNERLNKAACTLLEAGIRLDGELLEAVDHHRDKLFTDGETSSDRMRAFTFLKRRELEVSIEALKGLEALPRSSDAVDWSPLLTASTGNRSTGFDLRKLLKKLGLDLPALLGRRPKTASRSLNATLLGRTKSGAASPGEKRMLSVFLAQALNNVDDNNEVNLLLPLTVGDQFRELHLWLKTGERPPGWREPNWRGSLLIYQNGRKDLRVDLDKAAEELVVVLKTKNQARLDKLSREMEEFKKILTRAGYKLEIKLELTEPADLPDPIVPEPGRQESDDFGGINLIA